MKHFIVGAVILVIAFPVLLLLKAIGLSNDVAGLIAIALAIVGGSFQAYAFYQTWVEDRTVRTNFSRNMTDLQSYTNSLMRNCSPKHKVPPA